MFPNSHNFIILEFTENSKPKTYIMKKQLLTLFAVAISAISYAQTDTIFTNNEKISCSVKEITQDAVKYSFVGEDLMNSIYKNAVQKIVFKSGRVQTFAEATSFKKVKSVDDYDNVTITQVESEVRGLFKVGDVSAKAKGATTMSNQERVKERAYNKLKIGAALMGANIVYITNQRTEGNKQGSKYQAGSSTETSLSGVAYSNQLPSFDEFKSLIKDKRNFIVVEEAKLWSSGSDMSKSPMNAAFKINNMVNENGIIKIDGDLQDVNKYKSFRVVNVTKDSFNIYYEDKSTAYNLKVIL